MTKLYLHNEAGSNANTRSAIAAKQGGGAQYIHPLRDTADTAEGWVARNSAASTSAQFVYFGIWQSAALAAQTIAAQNWTFALFGSEGNAAANMQFSPTLYVYRPSSSSVVGYILDNATLYGTELATGGAGEVFTVAGAAVTCQAGDLLVLELHAGGTQSMATSYEVRAYFGGTTDATQDGTGTAAFLESAGTLSWQPAYTYQQVLSGGMTPAGALARAATKTLAGGLTLTAIANRAITKLLLGAVGASGALTAGGGAPQEVAIAGALTPAGAAAKQTTKVAAGTFAAGSGATPTVTNLAAGTENTGATSIARSVTPPAGSQVVVFLWGHNLSAAPTVSGLGLTWALVESLDIVGWRDAYCWVGTGTPSSGTVTITRAGTDTFTNHVFSIEAVASTSGRVQSRIAYDETAGGVSTLAYTSAWASGSAGLVYAGVTGGGTGSTPRSGWTELADTVLSGAHALASHTRTTVDTAGGADWSAGGVTTEVRVLCLLEFGAGSGGAYGLAGELSPTLAAPNTYTQAIAGAIAAAGALVRRATKALAGTLAGSTPLHSHDFSSGSLAPYTNPWGTDIDVVDDPTSSGRGKVARILYRDSDSSDGTLGYTRGFSIGAQVPRIGLGDTFTFEGEVYLHNIGSTDLSGGRKLLYWQKDPSDTYPNIYFIFGLDQGGLEVVHGFLSANRGEQLVYDDTGFAFAFDQWFSIKSQITIESSPGAANGQIRSYVNGSLVHTRDNCAFFGSPALDTDWASVNFDNVGFYSNMIVGDQVNRGPADPVVDEYRYWDNIVLSMGGSGLTGSVATTEISIYTQAIAGALTPAGAILRRATKLLASSVSPTAALTRLGTKVLASGIAADSSVVKRAAKLLAGTVSSSSAVGLTKTGGTPTLVALAGAIVPAAALVGTRFVLGIITPELQRQLDRFRRHFQAGRRRGH